MTVEEIRDAATAAIPDAVKPRSRVIVDEFDLGNQIGVLIYTDAHAWRFPRDVGAPEVTAEIASWFGRAAT